MKIIQSRSKELCFKALDISLLILLASLPLSIAVAQSMAAISAVLWIVLMTMGMKYKPTKLDWAILVYVFVRLLAIIFSEYPDASSRALLRELAFYITYFVFAFYLQHTDKKRLSAIFRWLIIATMISTIISVSKYLIIGGVDRALPLTGGGVLATHLCLVLLIIIAAANNKELFPSKIYWLAALLVIALGLVFSMTRGDMIAAFIITAIYAWNKYRKLLIGLAVFALAVLLIPSVQSRLATMLNPVRHSSDRITIWQEALRHSDEHPLLGFGPETFQLIFDNWEEMGDKKVNSWHNDFIQLYIESGILGVVSWALILILLFVWSVKLILNPAIETHDFDFGWLGALLIIAYIIIGFFSVPTVSITNAMLFRFIIAIVAVQYNGLFAPSGIKKTALE